MKRDVYERLENEQVELVKKIEKLEAFTVSSDFDSLSDIHKYLLLSQINYMMSYNNILCMRLRCAGDVSASD